MSNVLLIFSEAGVSGDIPAYLTISTLPFITGTKENGQTLTLDSGEYVGTVGLAFQWLSDGSEIPGATLITYQIESSTIANSIITCKVVVTYGINSVTLIAPYDETDNPIDNFVISTAPTLSGTASVGEVLTTSEGSYSPVADSITYQWIRSTTPISGQTSNTYTLTSDDFVDSALVTFCRLTVTIGNDTITLDSKLQTPSGDLPATFTVLTAPYITSSGETSIDVDDVFTLNINTSTYFNPIPDVVTYQWLRDGSNIGGATNSTYTAVLADVGTTITCRVTLTYGINSLTLISTRPNTTGDLPISLICTELPYITGSSEIDGVLTIFQGTYTGNSHSYTLQQQWLSNGVAINGETGETYTVTIDTAATTITCRVEIVLNTGVGDNFYLVAKRLITESARIPFYSEILADNNVLFELHPNINLLDAGGSFPDVDEEVATWKDSSGKYFMTFPSENRPVYKIDDPDNRAAAYLDFNTSKYGTLSFTDLNGTNLPFTIYIVGKWPETFPASDITLAGLTTGGDGSGATLIRSYILNSNGRLISTVGSTSIGGVTDPGPAAAVAPQAGSRFIYCLTSNGEKQNALYVSEGGLVVSIDQARSFDSGSRNINELILGARRDTAVQQFFNGSIYHVIVLGKHTYNPTSVINSLGQAYKFNLSQPRVIKTFEPDECFYFDAEATTHVSMLNTGRTVTESGTWNSTDDGMNGSDLGIKPTANTDFLQLANASVPTALFLKNNKSFTIGCAFKFVNDMQPSGAIDLNLLGLNTTSNLNWNIFFRNSDSWQLYVRYTNANGSLASWDTNLLPIFTSAGGDDLGGWNTLFFGREKTASKDVLFISLNGSTKIELAYPNFTNTSGTASDLRLGAMASLFTTSARNGFSWFGFKSNYAITDNEIQDTINSRVFQGSPERSRPPFRI